MNKLNYEEFKSAPIEVQILWASAMANRPVSASFYTDTMEKYPEYFQDVIEKQRKWDAIPQDVKDAFDKERSALHAKCFESLPPSKGILHWARFPDEYEQWNKVYRECESRLRSIEEKLYGRHFGKYLNNE